jgi:hypothetical protein
MREKIDETWFRPVEYRGTHKPNPYKSKVIRMSFANLKKQSSLGSLTSKLVKEVEKMNNTSSGGDDRLWKPEMDKTGNGYAVIRFLPAPDGEELPWAKMYSHAFQGPGGWYIENSLTTLGQKDPVSEHNRELWNSGLDSDKDTVRKQKRKLSYYANIYVVQDAKQTLRTKVVSSFTSSVRRSLTRSWNPCNLSMRMKLPSILLISGRVLTSNSN